MKRLLIAVVCVSLFFVSVMADAASSKSCFSHYSQLKKIQDEMRKGYSAKQGEKLRQKQKDAREKWWDCKNGKTPDKKGVNKNKKDKEDEQNTNT